VILGTDSTKGKMGDIRGRPKEEDIAKITEDARKLADRILQQYLEPLLAMKSRKRHIMSEAPSPIEGDSL
jgi:hypothetical protein